jgi:hypothetical protein
MQEFSIANPQKVLPLAKVAFEVHALKVEMTHRAFAFRSF